MNTARFEKLQELFERLRDLPEAEWHALIERETPNDPELKSEIERLLAKDRDLGADPSEKEPMPQQIGPYHILGEIGSGGMGTVFKAEQREPVRRLLALKVVQAGLRTKEVLARFHVERKALAAMNHRHIAKVFDAGATPQGQPYFAMELVDGLPLGEYCDRHRLSLPQRLRLFQQICDGVQHAHQKGVVHRDLKPGNVLVATEGPDAVPKIVDFGLAKATDRDFVDVSLITTQDQVLGTFEYMSPEQAHGDSELVDSRADVYSLGVMLYELLCGELPFTSYQLRRSGRLEALRMIREQEPAKPSDTLAARPNRADVAAQRQMSFGSLHKALRGDLDWVALKAMAKEPERRYAAATLLAADIQRHLDFEPVLASPPSIGYRVQKFVRRYRGQCLAAVAVAGIVTGGVGTWLGFSGMLALQRAESARNRVFADAALLAEARTKAETLYPTWPEMVPALQAWLVDHGEPLADRLPHFRDELEALRRRASPRAVDPQETEKDVAVRRRLSSDLAKENIEPRRVELADQLRRLELSAELRTFDFADANDALVHGTLTRLVRDLEDFVAPPGPLHSVRARLVKASAVRRQTIDAHRDKWDEAIAAIRASDGITASHLHEHLSITPQLGLVPLGMDRESKLWEFVHLASGTPGKEIPPRDPETGRLIPTGDMGIVFVLLPGGKLPIAEGEQPQDRHSLSIEPFFLSKYELTHGQVLRLTNQRSERGASSSLVLPAVDVNWFDCRDFLGHEALILPTSAQWEYGCRATTSSPWWTGSSAESLLDNESPRNAQMLLPIGSMTPNPFGLYDTLGNAWEWCLDEWVEDKETYCFHLGSLDDTSPTNAPAGRFWGLSPSYRHIALGARPARILRP